MAALNSPYPEIRSTAEKLIEHFVDTEFVTRDFAWEEVIQFMAVFGKVLEGEAEIAFKNKWNPKGEVNLKPEVAVRCLLEFVKDPELLLSLETEAKVLDQKTHDVVHHAEDFRYMLRQLGEEIPEHYIMHFLKQAQGLHRSDDEFNVCCFMEYLVATEPVEEDPKKRAKK